MSPSLPPLRHLAKRLHPHLRGRLAENVARVSYALQGFVPLRASSHLAQTDLLLRRGSLIILVEVKYRTSRQRGHVAVTPAQRQRLVRQMRAISGHYPQCTLRLEVFLVFPQWPFVQRIRNPWPDLH